MSRINISLASLSNIETIPLSKKTINNTNLGDMNEVVDEEESDDLIPILHNENYDLKSAAQESRLEFNKLSSLEAKHFGNLSQENIEFFLLFRNCLLKHWLNEPFTRLDIKDIIKKLKIVDSDKLLLISKIYNFLERYGYINYGIFLKNLPHKCLDYHKTRHKIIVIGAGISGIITARQLTYFGFDVTILEASKRIGGRLYSFYKNGLFIDLGCSFISGTKGNPFRTIIKQLRKNAKRLKAKHKLFIDGEPVDRKKNLVVQNLFLLFLKFLYHLSLKKNINQIDYKRLSPENLFDMFMYCLELTAATKTLERFKKIYHIEENINIVMDKLKIEFATFLRNSNNFRILKCNRHCDDDVGDSNNGEYSDIEYSDDFDDDSLENAEFSQILKSHIAYFKSAELEEKYFNILGKFNELGKNDKFKDAVEFFSLEDKRILEWYFATIEYFLGAPLSNYSLESFAEENLEQNNSQYYCSDSYLSILTSLFKEDYNLKIQKKTQVKSIQLFENHVEIVTTKCSEVKTFTADAVVCTLPLGVLKKSVKPINDDSSENHVEFIPPLSNKKIASISKLGFGTINKVVLCFEEKFWQSSNKYLGNVALSRECRGEFMFYFSLHEQPVVTAIICGDSVNTMDITDDVVVVSKCYNTLKEIFENVPVPIFQIVSRWNKNPLFLGTHSYTSIDSHKEDFDVLAESVSFSDNHFPRLFFAGEHTNKEYPGTVHGAFLSGLRAAAEINDCFENFHFIDPL